MYKLILYTFEVYVLTNIFSPNWYSTTFQIQIMRRMLNYSAAELAQITVQPSASSDQIEVQQAQSTWNTKWTSSIMRFK